MADPAALKHFLSTVPPPMPIVYPGLLQDDDVDKIAAYLKLVLDQRASQGDQDAMAPAVYQQPTSDGTPEWQAMYSVLTHPRCINCHTMTNYPRQDDDRHAHVFSVVRGADDQGAPVARCKDCHGDENNPVTGIPGRSDWHVAPLSMAWETAPGVPMTGAELCAQLKDPTRNGGRDLAALQHHNETEPLVLWGWDPGTRWDGTPRATPPIGFDEFVAASQRWIDAGAPCPAQ